MEDLLDGLKRLKLRYTRDCVDEYCRIAAARDMSFYDFLKMIVTEEVAVREETQRTKRLRNAKIPAHKTLAEFDFSFQPSIPKREILELQTLRFVENHDNVILLGPPGLGKTHIATALAYEAAIQGKDVLFTTAQELVDNLYAALADGTVKNKLRALAKLDLVVIDELGYLPMDDTAGNHLFQVVSAAYERQSLIVTSNRPFQEWGALFPNPSLASATLDRLLHHAFVFTFSGDSYRMKGGTASL
ncbi:ATPase AAA [Alicyclobacillus hesperidum subsp. aegles]|uniref:IS21-like element helper ATPase IstB n=1 Tax=Alicyclobacillus hesperidum TaxID=89784 RepID=UPI000719284B|nr:IS21-like element helper ATPase IstB [Alicyclobacillus hesperidum]KRW92071.1 ATP-binding protein [Alicyclobacillus tengchongensis]GLG01809.1 ATPase AAA [Alicyclobacillus hesperidum subsp. aegles]